MSEEYKDPKEGGQWGEDDGPKVRYDDFVGRIVKDPNEPPNATLLSGYLGSSSEEAHVRLYLDEGLSRYVEIPEKAILHTQELPPEQSPLGGSLVWIDSGAEVVHGPVGSERRRATFLEGQIAQDYMGGGGGQDYGASGGITTQTRECLIGGPRVGTSQFTICPQPTQQVYCRTLTGILCTRFGPGCRRTIFEPHCTFAGPLCGRSIYYPCVTQNENICVASGFFGCNPEITIWEEQFGPQAAFARGGGVGGLNPNVGGLSTGFNCPSIFDNCATRESFCPTQDATCPSQLVICQSQFGGCITRTGCVSRFIRCPTVFEIRCQTFTGPRCISQVAICNTRICEVGTAFCGFGPPGGFDPARGAAQGFEPMAFAMQHGPGGGTPTQTPACPGPPGHQSQHQGCFPTQETQTPACFTLTLPPPTEICMVPTPHHPGCPTIQTQTPVCITQPVETQHCTPDLPTRYCPTQTPYCPQTQTPGCGGVGFAAAQAQFPQSRFVRCPSAVDACPTRFGCFMTAGCGESIPCFPGGFGGGGGGFNPGGGGGFGGGF